RAPANHHRHAWRAPIPSRIGMGQLGRSAIAGVDDALAVLRRGSRRDRGADSVHRAAAASLPSLAWLDRRRSVTVDRSRAPDYDALASGYDRRYQNFSYRETEETLAAFLGDAPVDAVLEVGCGTGHWLTWLGGRASRRIGVDASAGMLARAK